MPQTTTRQHWKATSVAVLGLVLACTGLTLAALSNPSRFSSNVRNDKYIDLLAGGGLACTLVGTGLFVLAVNRTTASMTRRDKARANLGIGLGAVFQLAGVLLTGPMQWHDLSGLVVILASLPLFVWGAMHYAHGKGQPKWLGCAGLLGIVGLVILMVLPDRRDVDVIDHESDIEFGQG